MMGLKTAQPKLYCSFSLDHAVPRSHLVRRLAAVINFSFVHGLVRRHYSHTGKPSVDPVVLLKLWLLGYLFNLTSERRLCDEASLNLTWRWFLGYELDEPISDRSVISKRADALGWPSTNSSSDGLFSSARRATWCRVTCSSWMRR